MPPQPWTDLLPRLPPVDVTIDVARPERPPLEDAVISPPEAGPRLSREPHTPSPVDVTIDVTRPEHSPLADALLPPPEAGTGPTREPPQQTTHNVLLVEQMFWILGKNASRLLSKKSERLETIGTVLRIK